MAFNYGHGYAQEENTMKRQRLLFQTFSLYIVHTSFTCLLSIMILPLGSCTLSTTTTSCRDSAIFATRKMFFTLPGLSSSLTSSCLAFVLHAQQFFFHFIASLWLPYGTGQAIIFLPWFISFYLSIFFPRLISAVADWMSAIVLHMVRP